MGEVGEGGQKARTCSYKTDKSWGVAYVTATAVNKTMRCFVRLSICLKQEEGLPSEFSQTVELEAPLIFFPLI